MDSHAHPLVSDVVALAEVVGAAGEGYRSQDRRDPDLAYVPGEAGDARGGRFLVGSFQPSAGALLLTVMPKPSLSP
jgi:hypothetical protein